MSKNASYKNSKIGPMKIIFIAIMAIAIIAIGYKLISPSSSPSADLYVGTDKHAPVFTLADVNGETFNLKDANAKSNVLLFFNEGLGCAPCLQQIKELNSDYSTFKDNNVVVVAISTDSSSSLQQWTQVNGINNIVILSDQNRSVDKMYDTLGSNVSMMPETKAGHTFILVDKSGLIKWRDDYGPDVMYVPDNEIISKMKSFLSV